MDARRALRARLTLDGIAFDTNILAYSEGIDRAEGDAAKIAASRHVLRTVHAAGARPQLAIQTMAELFNVLVRKGRMDRNEAGERVRRLMSVVDVVPTDGTTLTDAIALAAEHRLQIFDAIILSAAARSGCRLLLSEDLHDGFHWHGVTVRNPFVDGFTLQFGR